MNYSNYLCQYIEINPIHEPGMIYEFIQEKYFSNFSKVENAINKLVAFEKNCNRKKKVYAVSLKCKLANVTIENRKDIVKEFMKKIDPGYFEKGMLYLYKFYMHGKYQYVEIIAFEREVYITGKEVPVVYKRDMYIDPKSGKMTTKDDPNAIKLCSKGEVKKINGKKVMKNICVSEVKARCFSYDKFKMESSIKKRFEYFTNRLKHFMVRTIHLVLKSLTKFQLHKKSYRKTMSKTNKIKIMNYNAKINKINERLANIQEIFDINPKKTFIDQVVAYKSFRKIFKYISNIQKDEAIKISEKYSISLSTTNKLSFKQLYNNLDYFVESCDQLIDEYIVNHIAEPKSLVS